uniref:Uncharacterized protein n=1 Tax=Branchiostoma floridae TaxID=7739 RepID=C3ZI30_BRAFL|eukprot:XP_002591761.1 hypothetical protein BRAFLDRAFT_83535 [Branchiostoma floridae]
MEARRHLSTAVVLLGNLISIVSTSAIPINRVSDQGLTHSTRVLTQVSLIPHADDVSSTVQEASRTNVQIWTEPYGYTTANQDTTTSFTGNGMTTMGTAMSTRTSAKITTLELKEHLYNGPPDCTITIVEMKPLPSSKFTRISPDLTI